MAWLGTPVESFSFWWNDFKIFSYQYGFLIFKTGLITFDPNKQYFSPKHHRSPHFRYLPARMDRRVGFPGVWNPCCAREASSQWSQICLSSHLIDSNGTRSQGHLCWVGKDEEGERATKTPKKIASGGEKRNLGGGGNSNIFLFSARKLRKRSNFDSYFSRGLKPPTRNCWKI